MQHQNSVCVDCHLKPVKIDFGRPKSCNFSYVLSVPSKILLPRLFSEDRPFQADRVVMIYEYDDMEIGEKNNIWRSHFDQDLYTSYPEDVMAYLFDDYADMPTNMRKYGAIITKTIKRDAVREWKESRLSKLSSYITEGPSYKKRKLEYQILQRVQYCLAEGIPYSSDSIAIALQFKYIQKST